MNASETIEYKRDAVIGLEQFTELYRRSTLAERRPSDDSVIMQQMMQNASLTISAWAGDELVGISRTLTDFGYVAYLADLAVAKTFQGQSIGRRLVQETKAALDSNCMLVLLSAPKANAFYPAIGFEHNPRAWVLNGDDPVL